MRAIFSLFLALEFMVAPVLANVGERVPFHARTHLTNIIAQQEAKSFERDMRQVFKRVGTEDPVNLVKDLGSLVSEDEKASLLRLLKKTGTVNPVFKEKSPGKWEFKSSDHSIHFTSLDLYQGQMWINGRLFKFKDMPFSKIEGALAGFEAPPQTSFLRLIFEKTLGIESAHALGPFIIIVGVVAVAILGYAIWELKTKPEKMVKRMNDIQSKLAKDATACEEAPTDRSNYEKTFALASSVSNRSSYNTASASGAFEYALKEQLSAGTRKNTDCFEIMHEIGKQIDLQIPVPTDRQIQMRELGGGAKVNSATDVTSAVFNLCSSYNALGACMETFVADHVNDGIGGFKDSASESFYRYQKRSRARAQ